jgi:hypothetical protein
LPKLGYQLQQFLAGHAVARGDVVRCRPLEDGTGDIHRPDVEDLVRGHRQVLGPAIRLTQPLLNLVAPSYGEANRAASDITDADAADEIVIAELSEEPVSLLRG